MAKSYWQSVSVEGERSQDAIKSWLHPMAEGMTAYKAEILCDIETDREKKVRALMTDAAGDRYQLERTLGGKTCSITRKRLPNISEVRQPTSDADGVSAPAPRPRG